MNEMRKAVLVAVGLVLVFASGCPRGRVPPPGGASHGQQDQRKFEVYIYTDATGKCWLDWPVATLWKDYHQTVKWYSDDGNQYVVDFGQGTLHAEPKNPFQDSDPPGTKTFKVPAGTTGRHSGKLRDDASGYYDFAVLDAQNHKCKEPSDPGYYVK